MCGKRAIRILALALLSLSIMDSLTLSLEAAGRRRRPYYGDFCETCCKDAFPNEGVAYLTCLTRCGNGCEICVCSPPQPSRIAFQTS